MSNDERPDNTTSTVTTEVAKDGNPISLIDSTASHIQQQPQLSSAGSWRGMVRIPTTTSVREQYNRRKYARWKPDQSDADDSPVRSQASKAADPRSSTTTTSAKVVKEDAKDKSEAVDFAQRASTDEPQQTGSQKPRRKRRKHADEAETDILYENQRGFFFCGIPLYSHSSLLQFDPSPWANKDFKNSAVNITNAQVPDPSWTWAWKSWYVDMSHDVDEEGWQYSFAFSENFSWHGTHPWFHSFVRRRRWLRKRMKRHDQSSHKPKNESMSAAHHLNPDYFTIHSKQRGRSPSSVQDPEAVLPRNASYSSLTSIDDLEASPEDIRDIPALSRAIRRATIDREKIDAVKGFVENSGDELVYLTQQIPEIMSSLLFQSSRRQLLEFLKQSAAAAQTHREEHEAEHREEGEEEKRKIDNLLKAADAANGEIGGLEYWSDRKHVLQTTDETGDGDQIGFTSPFDEKQPRPDLDDHPADDIRGIPEKAETSKPAFVNRRLKGKERASEDTKDDGPKTEQKESSKPIPQLGKDDVFIPDT